MRTFKVPEMPEPTLICSFCGLHTLVNSGVNIVCTNCGKRMLKIKRQKEGVKGRYEKCLYCGSDDTILNGGVRMICKTCGRSFKKRIFRRDYVQNG